MTKATEAGADPDPLAEKRAIAAAVLLEKEFENSEEAYRDIFPPLMRDDDLDVVGVGPEGEDLAAPAHAHAHAHALLFKGTQQGVAPGSELVSFSKSLVSVSASDENDVGKALVSPPPPGNTLVVQRKEDDGIVNVASATPLKDQWKTFHTEGKLLSWKRKCGKDVLSLAFRTWLVQTPLVSEMADKLQGSTYYEVVYNVKRRKYESFKTWALVVAGMQAMNRLGLMRWRLDLAKKAFMSWTSYVQYAKSKSRNARRSIVHRVRLGLRIKHYYLALWRQRAHDSFRLNTYFKRLKRSRDFSSRRDWFRKWRTITLIFLFERKKKSLQSVITWQWLTKYMALCTQSEEKIEKLEKECNRLYDWEKHTCKELKEAAEALEHGETNRIRLEKELVDATEEAVRSRKAGFLQAMEASRNLLPNVSKNVSMLSLAHLNLRANVQNDLDICQEQMNYFFQTISNKMFAEQRKTDEKVKALKNFYEKNIVMILSALRDEDTEEKIREEGCELEQVLPVILSQISKLMEVKDDADAALNARQIQLDIVTRNADTTIESLKESENLAQEALVNANKDIDSLKSIKYTQGKEIEQLQSEIENQKRVYDILYQKHEDLSDHFVKNSEKSNQEMQDILKLKEEEIHTLQGSCDGLRKRMEEQQGGHNQEISLLQEMSNDLQDKLESTLNELAKTKRHAEELNTKYATYNLDIEKEQIKVNDLNERFSKADEELQSLKKEKINLKSRLEKSLEENLELGSDKALLEQSLEDKEAKLENVRQQNAELEAHKENYVLEIQELKAEIEALHDSVSVRSSKIHEIEQVKSELSSTAMQYEEEISSLKAEKEGLQESLAKKNSKISDIEQQKNELESVVDGYLENNVELSNEKEALQQAISKKDAKIKDTLALNSELESKIESQKDTIKKLEDDAGKLEQNLSKANKMLEDKEGGISEKTSQLQDLQQANSDFEGTIEKQSDQIKTLQNDNDKLKQSIDRKSQQLKDKENNLTEKAQELSKLEETVESQSDEIKTLKGERDKLQQNLEKKNQQLQESADLGSAHAKLEATIENQIDEINRLKNENERLALVNDKKALLLQARDSDMSQKVAHLDDMERKISQLQGTADAQKSEVRQLKSENERLQKKVDKLDAVNEKYEELELELKEMNAESRDLQKVKTTFVKYKGILSILFDKITNKQLHKLSDVESDVKEFSCVIEKLSSLASQNEELTKECEELKLLYNKFREKSRNSRRKAETSSIRAFKNLNRRASFVPTQLPSQVWADETNRPRVADLVLANEALFLKIERKANTKGGVDLDMVSKYIMRKAFAVWLQAVGSEAALQRLKQAGGTILEEP